MGKKCLQLGVALVIPLFELFQGDGAVQVHFQQALLLLLEEGFFLCQAVPPCLAVLLFAGGLEDLEHGIHNGFPVPQDLAEHRGHQPIQFPGEQPGGAAPGFSLLVVDLALPHFGAALTGLPQPPVVAGVVGLAEDLPAVRVAAVVIRGLLVRLDLFAAQPVEGVGPVPQLLGHNGRDGRVGVEHPVLFVQEDPALGAVVHSLAFPGAVPAFVLGVAEHVPDGHLVESVSPAAGTALLVKLLGDLPNAQPLVGVQVEDPPDNGGFPLVDGEHTVLLVVAPQLVVSQHMAVFYGLVEAELQPLRKLSHLILGHARHNGQPELAVRVHGVDVVVLEQHSHVVLQQLLGVLYAVQGGAGKPGDLLGDDEIEPSGFGIPDHPEKAVPIFGAGAADALIDVPGNVSPAGFGLDQLRIVLYLVFQAVQLLGFVGGHPGVERHPQGQVENGPAFSHLTAHFQNVHPDPPPCLPAGDTPPAGENRSWNQPDPKRRNRRLWIEAPGASELL